MADPAHLGPHFMKPKTTGSRDNSLHPHLSLAILYFRAIWQRNDVSLDRLTVHGEGNGVPLISPPH